MATVKAGPEAGLGGNGGAGEAERVDDGLLKASVMSAKTGISGRGLASLFPLQRPEAPAFVGATVLMLRPFGLSG